MLVGFLLVARWRPLESEFPLPHKRKHHPVARPEREREREREVCVARSVHWHNFSSYPLSVELWRCAREVEDTSSFLLRRGRGNEMDAAWPGRGRGGRKPNGGREGAHQIEWRERGGNI